MMMGRRRRGARRRILRSSKGVGKAVEDGCVVALCGCEIGDLDKQ